MKKRVVKDFVKQIKNNKNIKQKSIKIFIFIINKKTRE